jgi:hypothetical protein
MESRNPCHSKCGVFAKSAGLDNLDESGPTRDYVYDLSINKAGTEYGHRIVDGEFSHRIALPDRRSRQNPLFVSSHEFEQTHRSHTASCHISDVPWLCLCAVSSPGGCTRKEETGGDWSVCYRHRPERSSGPSSRVHRVS